jgi:hypothetical protein
MSEQIHRTKINKSNDRPNVYLFCNFTCLSSLCVLVLSFDLFMFALCICSVIWLVYLRSVYLLCHLHRTKINKSNDRPNTQSEDMQVKWQNKYTERRYTSLYLFCHLTCLSSFCVFVLSFDLHIFALRIWSVIWLVYLRSVYLFCHLTCISSLCVFGLSFDLFIFVLWR